MLLGDVNVLPPLEPHVNETSGDTGNSNAKISPSKMKAVHYESPFKVSVKEIEAPTIQHSDDAIIKSQQPVVSFSSPSSILVNI